MTISSREQAAQRAEASRTNTPGTCQLWTRTMFGSPSVGDVDQDGDSDAVDGWKSEPLTARHADREPPLGTPVAWSGGRRGFGHRAISLGRRDGRYMIRSTDAGGEGKVATVPLEWVEQNWGLTYLGWSDTIGGALIPGAPKPPPVPTRVEQVRQMVERARHIGWKASRANPPGPRRWAINAGLALLRAALRAFPPR